MNIERMNKGEWGKIKAFFDLRTEDGFVIKGFKLVQGINGLFVGFPSQKGNDNEYYDTVFAERELKDELSQMAIDFYGQEVMPTDTDMSMNTMTPESMPSIASNESEASPANKEATFTDDDIPF